MIRVVATMQRSMNDELLVVIKNTATILIDVEIERKITINIFVSNPSRWQSQSKQHFD